MCKYIVCEYSSVNVSKCRLCMSTVDAFYINMISVFRLTVHQSLRPKLGNAKTLQECKDAVKELKEISQVGNRLTGSYKWDLLRCNV